MRKKKTEKKTFYFQAKGFFFVKANGNNIAAVKIEIEIVAR